ncbi:MAG: hypothetical protein RMZ41_029570 [Nostoc sp. DedVER02]|uniref:hypothetical protein n=1 Tax=unclassified Nostoc TaxID=2593658 RepID=UPI002AD2FEA6|nr:MULTISPECIES: hypothetical protein [unclassified Nostoc]MDZ7989039.1 hypothetical protein [Nostoc sp. DedVER02]MDZ8112541.1 hypothetical protein [Nostoc sp. DedVER01b]
MGGHIKNERQARSQLRLVKEPEKLKQAVAIALKDNPDPSVSDFVIPIFVWNSLKLQRLGSKLPKCIPLNLNSVVCLLMTVLLIAQTILKQPRIGLA